MPTEKPAHPTKHAKVPVPVENTTDATRGQPLATRARMRRAELEEVLRLLSDDRLLMRTDLEMALAEVDQWLAADVEHVSYVTAGELSRWLERTKHLAEVTPRAQRNGGQ